MTADIAVWEFDLKPRPYRPQTPCWCTVSLVLATLLTSVRPARLPNFAKTA